MNREILNYTPIELNQMPERREIKPINFQLENFYNSPIELQNRIAQTAINKMNNSINK